jgi:hypothetical protein
LSCPDSLLDLAQKCAVRFRHRATLAFHYRHNTDLPPRPQIAKILARCVARLLIDSRHYFWKRDQPGPCSNRTQLISRYRSSFNPRSQKNKGKNLARNGRPSVYRLQADSLFRIVMVAAVVWTTPYNFRVPTRTWRP